MEGAAVKKNTVKERKGHLYKIQNNDLEGVRAYTTAGKRGVSRCDDEKNTSMSIWVDLLSPPASSSSSRVLIEQTINYIVQVVVNNREPIDTMYKSKSDENERGKRLQALQDAEIIVGWRVWRVGRNNSTSVCQTRESKDCESASEYLHGKTYVSVYLHVARIRVAENLTMQSPQPLLPLYAFALKL